MTPVPFLKYCMETTRHWLIFSRIALHVAIRYALGLKFADYLAFLRRAALLLLTFRHNRIVRIKTGYKLQLYLPAYPSPAFFAALENKLLRTPPASTSVVFSMTRSCANACPHCYQKTETGRDLDDAVYVRTFNSLMDAGVTFFNIEGGEPFLRFERLLAILAAADNRVEIWVNTTGNQMTPERLTALGRKGLSGIMVSLHSPYESIHDAFTGTPGAFAMACDALRLAKKQGLGTAVNSVLSEEALQTGGLDALMALASSLGADYVQLIHPKPCGGWLEKRDAMQTDTAVLDFIENQHLYYNSAAKAGFPSLAAQVFEERKAGVGCTAGGIDRFYVTAGGDVQPCEFLQLSFGNVIQEDFETIFSRMRSAYAIPGTGWLCCTHGIAIAGFMQKNRIQTTPVPWPLTLDFLAEQGASGTGESTPLYAKLGIYTP